jgi:transposase-like protein
MAGPDLDKLSALLDDAKCFALVRQHRWPDGVRCPACASGAVIRDGCDDRQRSRQRYRCKACSGRFDDLTGRCWLAITSRCGSGCCAYTSWG